MSAALRPFAFQWHITDNCDQRCKHCYIFSKDPGKELLSMTLAQMEATVDNCCEFCERFRRRPCFSLTGGDPILHPDFWRLAELLQARGLTFAIMGNPFHLTDEVCERLAAAGCERCQMSLDGLRETHDWFRKPGSFDCTLEKIKCLHHAGILSTIMTTVSSANIREIPALIDVVAANEVDVYAFARFCPARKQGATAFPQRIIGLYWMPAGISSRSMRRPAAAPDSTSRIISGRCIAMKSVILRSRRMRNRESSMKGATAETAI